MTKTLCDVCEADITNEKKAVKPTIPDIKLEKTIAGKLHQFYIQYDLVEPGNVYGRGLISHQEKQTAMCRVCSANLLREMADYVETKSLYGKERAMKLREEAKAKKQNQSV